jgi:hypothetical protein
MKLNVGQADRFIRLLLAAVIVVLFFANVISGTLGTVLLVVGGILVITSFIGTCPLYMLFGLSTVRKKSKSK